MTFFSWGNFANVTRDNPHWPLMERGADLVGHAGDALDLGAGGGRDTRYLLAHGWHVTAVDGEPAAIAILSQIGNDNLTVVQSTIQDFPFEREKYDLVNAQFSLPFVPPAQFVGVFASIREAIKPGGVFAGTFFGPRDSWNRPENDFNFLSRSELDNLLADVTVKELTEEERMGETASGEMKHWHVFHVIARKAEA